MNQLLTFVVIQVNTVLIRKEGQILPRAAVQHWNTVHLNLIPKQDSVQGISVNQDGWDQDVSTVGETTVVKDAKQTA